MVKRVRRTVSLGVKLAKAVKNVAKREVKALIKSGMISRTGGKKLVSSVVRYALAEKRRVEGFVKQELKRAMKVSKLPTFLFISSWTNLVLSIVFLSELRKVLTKSLPKSVVFIFSESSISKFSKLKKTTT